jgi:ubiquinone/menaquinone biosynthesis C-methylase UbiE
MMTADQHAQQHGTGEPVGLVLHSPFRYDLRLFLHTGGREGAFRRSLVELAGIKAGDRVLDVGCGTGSLAIAAAKVVGTAGSVVGIDPSPEFIVRAAKKAGRAGNVRFVTGAAQDLPFDDASFDVALCTLVFHQLPPDGIHAAVAEMVRILKPGGRVMIVDIGGDQGDRQTIHVKRAAQHGAHLFDLQKAAPRLAEFGLKERATGEVPFRLYRFERVVYVLAVKAGPAQLAPRRSI